MKFSILTPTHNAEFLPRLERSLALQTCQDFEWLILPNGGLPPDDLPVSVPQARVLQHLDAGANIGLLKQHAGFHARGEFVVEVDHDDELTPDCLSELARAFEDGTDFVYSNFCCVGPDWTPQVFGERFGWLSRPFNYGGHELLEQVAFPPDPASFSKIWFAPNHVRAWRRFFYLDIGGHNQELKILDDHELLCRTYIQGSIKHIDKCLYIYHIHTANTCYGEQNASIQSGTLDIHDRYIYQLVERWCDLTGLRKIDLCGGFNCPAGYEGADLCGAAITCDLNARWPFEDGTVGLFRAHDALEHIRDPRHAMREACRCLAPCGWLLTLTPSTDGRGAFQDPTHVSFWNSNSFWYYTNADQAKFIGTPARFQLNRIKNFFPSPWHEQQNLLYVKADLYKFAGRTPGLVEI